METNAIISSSTSSVKEWKNGNVRGKKKLLPARGLTSHSVVLICGHFIVTS